MEKFIDRKDAGITLAKYIKQQINQNEINPANTILLALPRGGVPVAYEISFTCSIPMDIFIVRKLGVPGHEELAMGAIAGGGTVIFNDNLMHALNLSKAAVDEVIAIEQKELLRREHLYRGNRPFPILLDKTVILVDDGIATGATMEAAVCALKKYGPQSIIIAVPVAAPETCKTMSELVDKIICPLQPIDFSAVGLWYENFTQVTDNEVISFQMWNVNSR